MPRVDLKCLIIFNIFVPRNSDNNWEMKIYAWRSQFNSVLVGEAETGSLTKIFKMKYINRNEILPAEYISFLVKFNSVASARGVHWFLRTNYHIAKKRRWMSQFIINCWIVICNYKLAKLNKYKVALHPLITVVFVPLFICESIYLG